MSSTCRATGSSPESGSSPLGHELAAAGDIAESRVGAVGKEVRRGLHGDQHGNRHDRDRDGRGTDDHSAAK